MDPIEALRHERKPMNGGNKNAAVVGAASAAVNDPDKHIPIPRPVEFAKLNSLPGPNTSFPFSISTIT